MIHRYIDQQGSRKSEPNGHFLTRVRTRMLRSLHKHPITLVGTFLLHASVIRECQLSHPFCPLPHAMSITSPSAASRSPMNCRTNGATSRMTRVVLPAHASSGHVPPRVFYGARAGRTPETERRQKEHVCPTAQQFDVYGRKEALGGSRCPAFKNLWSAT